MLDREVGLLPGQLGGYANLLEPRLAAALTDALQIGKLRWIGTSMGGAIGIKVAAGALRDRITHLVLNDIGPKVADAAVARSARTPATRRDSPKLASSKPTFAPSTSRSAI